jgi:hypothetical protein
MELTKADKAALRDHVTSVGKDCADEYNFARRYEASASRYWPRASNMMARTLVVIATLG